MRELQLAGCEDGVAELFDEILQLSTNCRFRDCRHRDDEGCAVVAAVQAGELDARRLTNYLKLHAEQARNAQSLRERRQNDRKLGRMYKSIIASKREKRRIGLMVARGSTIWPVELVGIPHVYVGLLIFANVQH